LRGGFRHHFVDWLLDQPFAKQLQLLGNAAVPAPLKLVFLLDFDIRDNHG
jgi:hypothetical protein